MEIHAENAPPPGAPEDGAGIPPTTQSPWASNAGVAALLSMDLVPPLVVAAPEPAPVTVYTPRLQGHRHPAMTGLSHVKTSPRFSFGSARPKERALHLAPAADMHSYTPREPHTTSKMMKTPAFGFGSARTGRTETAKATPGPGSYSHRDFVGDKSGDRPSGLAATAMSPRTPRTSSADSAGRFGFGSSITPRQSSRQVPEKPKELAPHAHTYRPCSPHQTSRMVHSPRVSMDKAATGRISPTVAERKASPGPGAYGHKEHLGKESQPGAVLNLRHKHRRASESPLPRPDFHTYSPRDVSSTSRMRLGPKHGFGSANTGRTTTDKHGYPGPGHYGGHYTQFVTA